MPSHSERHTVHLVWGTTYGDHQNEHTLLGIYASAENAEAAADAAEDKYDDVNAEPCEVQP